MRSASIVMALVLGGIASADPPVKFCTPEAERKLRSLLPRTPDNIRADDKLIFYTDREVPPAFQDFSNASRHIRDIHYNIAAIKTGPNATKTGNYREFPWQNGFGLDHTNAQTFKFVKFPERNGRPLPMAYWTEGQWGKIEWAYPVGTVFGEVLLVIGLDGYGRCVEMRTRTKDIKNWTPNVVRPFETAAELKATIEQEWPDWRDHADLAALHKACELPPTGDKRRVYDKLNRDKHAFDITVHEDILPALKAEHVDKLLGRPLHSVAKPWKQSDAAPAAPTTKAPYHIVPQNYFGGFVEVSRDSCMKCHQDTGKDVRSFSQSREWYGQVSAGSDGILSFHPFAASCINNLDNGFNHRPMFRRDLVDAGLIEKFDPRRHPPELYRRSTSPESNERGVIRAQGVYQ